ncbi:MAG: nucleotidyltransferase family protein, partial [Deltaproteobacteria bacterium]|nr:nucleotidyltransferase family protein [Deltaproteobacteria bacterium]
MEIREGISIDLRHLTALCARHNVRELAVFGSVLRSDFSAESDIDVLVEFKPDAEVGFLSLGALRRELEDLFGRPVDLVSKRGLKAAIRDVVLREA